MVTCLRNYQVQRIYVQLYLPGSANMHVHLIHDSFRKPTHHPKRHGSAVVARLVPYSPTRYIVPLHFRKKICPFPWRGSGSTPNTSFFWYTRPTTHHHQNDRHFDRVSHFSTIHACYQRTEGRADKTTTELGLYQHAAFSGASAIICATWPKNIFCVNPSLDPFYGAIAFPLSLVVVVVVVVVVVYIDAQAACDSGSVRQ